MKTRNLALCVALLLGMTGSAFAQDAMPDDAAGGDTAAPAEGGDVSAAPAEDTSADTADAGGPAKKISAGLLLGYGISFESGANFLGVGLGVRGGYNIDEIYLGARFVYNIGESPVSSWELGIEGGYDLSVADKLTLRPQLGLGIASLTVSIPSVLGTGGSVSSSEFYLAPGATLLYDVTPDIFLGLEARLMLITSSPMVKGLTLLANGGMRF